MNREIETKELIERAMAAQKRAYVPYSNYSVGAALIDDDGNIYEGCNIENAAFSPTVCAERVAIFKAVSEGAKSIKRIAVVAGEDMGYPCGVCRQVIREFGKDAEIIIARNTEEYATYHLDDLLPHSFGPESLKGE